jgi:hypothetical protein
MQYFSDTFPQLCIPLRGIVRPFYDISGFCA